MCMPTVVEPVKLIPATRASRINASPTMAPWPVTRLIAPGGTPAFRSSFTRYTADHGVSDDGLKTTVFPHARAGAILRTGATTGKFHGQIAAITPSGSATV